MTINIKHNIVLFIMLLASNMLSARNNSSAEVRVADADNAYEEWTETSYTWTSQSHNSSESMPCGGGDIGLNVWTENGDVVFYIARSGCFDENNTLLKLGRVRLHVTPKIANDGFTQTLHLDDGSVVIADGNTRVKLWVDVFKPVIHVAVDCKEAVELKAEYQNWRTKDHEMDKKEAQQSSYKWVIPKGTVTSRDVVEKNGETVLFYHRNPEKTIFDYAVHQQKLDGFADTMYNPISNLIFGGKMSVEHKDGDRHHDIQITLARRQGSVDSWRQLIEDTEAKVKYRKDEKATRNWWQNFWKRSYIKAGGEWAEAVRNYNLFRYMLGCNAKSEWPTKFNGGLFTFDPEYVDSAWAYTPDFRKWCGGTHTAQNQRLVYWPMLASGDADMMKGQFDYYNRILKTAELRVKEYWNHDGACFVEQLENYGLCNPAEYGSKRPADMNPGVEKNKWLEYEWDTILEFCEMILEAHDYANMDITEYIPLIESSLTFFYEHYRQGDSIVIWPGSACETYKMALNPSSTVAGLRTVLTSLIDYAENSRQGGAIQKERWAEMLERLPDIPMREVGGHRMISPAVKWERVQNVETPQLYPVFPWKIFGVGRDSIELAQNTYLYDPDALKFRSSKGWKQDNIWAACLGLTEEAKKLTLEKLSNGPYRFPAFWGPGFDWSPDHNWGGSGMIGLQMMLVQEAGDELLLFPAWDKKDKVSFKFHTRRHGVIEVK